MKTEKAFPISLTLVVAILCCCHINAQDYRIQYPGALKNSYYGVNIGYINYPFSSKQLEAGNSVGLVTVPHTAVRLTLYGRQINKYLSARLTYMRPVSWVLYKNVNGDNMDHSVWMNVGGLTLAAQIPLHKKLSLAAEAGIGLITRKGFSINNVRVIKNATYSSVLMGGALQYHINKKWELQASMAWSPAHAKEKQPQTIYFAAGFNYYMRELSPDIVERNLKSGFHFPKQSISAGITSNVLGYGANNFVSGKLPIFWGGDVKIKHGISLSYQRNIFHSRKVFALDVGANMAHWKSKENKENFFTASVYPVLIFNAFRTRRADIFFEYSVAGPSYISKSLIDGNRTGKNFTFQDFMGIGMVAGKKRKLMTGLRVAHYSNGNIYPDNAGLMIPLTLNLGYVLD